MLKLTEIMAKHQASFKAIKQTSASHKQAKIALVTHAMSEATLNAVKEEINALPEMELLAAYKVLGGDEK